MKRKKKINVVMFSGGYDSSLVAYKTLIETPEPVLLHHINMIDMTGRWLPERIACGKITRWMAENLRPFSYTESTIDFSSFLKIGSDEDLVLLTASRLTHDLEEEYEQVEILEGTIKDDFDNGPMMERHEKRGGMEEFFKRCSWMCKSPKISFPVMHLSKKEVLLSLPEGIRVQCFFCRSPNPAKGFAPCGECVTCKKIKEISNANYER